jgi:putative flippase GtrA
MNLRQLGWFGGVGVGAALTHAGVLAGVLRLVPTLPAAWANAAGFGVAFGVSYLGHRHLTFPGSQRQTRESLPMFALTSGLGFATNALVFGLLHTVWGVNLWAAWLVATGAASVQTFVLGKWWAFKR